MPSSVTARGESNLGALEHESKRELCGIGRRMYNRGFVVAREGNLSVRLAPNRVLVTPAGVCKGRLSVRDLLVVDFGGNIVSGTGDASSELQMHLLYYRSRPDVLAVCHAHPPTATAFATTGRALDLPVLPEIVMEFGEIPLSPYGTPGTGELCANLEPLVRNYNGILLANHGVVTAGPDLETAFDRLETIEQFARILLAAEALGGACLLSTSQVQKLTDRHSTSANKYSRFAAEVRHGCGRTVISRRRRTSNCTP
jgi:L-fuculose-phosphate aldolase